MTSAFCPPAFAQSLSIDWYSVGYGGGASAAGALAVSGTIGQPDPYQPVTTTASLSGGDFSLIGGSSQTPDLLWTNRADGDWHASTNWSPNLVPTKDHNAIINMNVAVTVDSPAECFGLTLGGFSASPTLTGSGTLTLHGPSTWVSGTMSGSGRTLVEADGTLSVANPAATAVFLNTRTLENGGAVLWTGGGSIVFNGGVITNRPGALFHVQNASEFVVNNGSPRFDNAGTFRKSANSGDTTAGITFNNSGTVEIQTGTFRFRGGGAATGTFDTAAGALVEWRGGGVTLNAGAELKGAGLYKINLGTVTADADITAENLDFAAGNLDGAGQLTIVGVMNWLGGNMSGKGRTFIAPGATLSVSNTGAISLIGRTLDNAGKIVVTGAGGFGVDSSSVITNRAGALFDLQSAESFGSIFAPNRIDNAGTFRKSLSPGTTAVSGKITFNNSGTVEIQSGTLSLGGDGTHTGSFAVLDGATLNLAGGTHSAAAGSSITGAGQLMISGGTANLAGLVNVRGNNTFNGSTANLTGNTICSNNTVTISGGTANFSGTGLVSPAVVNLSSSGALDGTSTVTVNGVMNWTGGSMTGTGRTIIPPGATLNAAFPAGATLISRTLENGGTVLWTGPGGITMSTGAVITNRPGALFHVQNSAPFQCFGVNRFDNAGTFRKSASTGITAIGNAMSFNNSGTVDIRSGILAATGSGIYNSTANALLKCALGGTTPGAGYGQLQVAGPVTLGGDLSVDLINGFSPTVNESFTVLTAGTRNGTFRNFSFPPDGPILQLSNTPASVIVRVVEAATSASRPTLLQPQLTAPDLRLTWTAAPNVTYRLEYTSDLSRSNWNPLSGDLIAANNLASKIDLLSKSNRFYRVRVLP